MRQSVSLEQAQKARDSLKAHLLGRRPPAQFQKITLVDDRSGLAIRVAHSSTSLPLPSLWDGVAVVEDFPSEDEDA